MKRKLVSIIIPAYNVQTFIERALHSLLTQTYEELEILVINDGSTDNTVQIVNNFAKNDTRLKLITKENGGVSSARNKGLDYAKGEYISFVDADDWVEPSFISKMVEMLEDHKVEFTICGIEAVSDTHTACITGGSDGEYNRIKCAMALLSSGGVAGQPTNKLYLRSIIEENHLRFDQKITNAEDLLFQVEYVSLISAAYFCNESLYKYTVIEGSASHGFTNGNKIRVSRLTELDAYRKICEVFSEKEIYDLVRDKENHFRMEILKTILERNLEEEQLYRDYRSLMLKRIMEIIKSDVEPIKGKVINLLALLLPGVYRMLKKKG